MIGLIFFIISVILGVWSIESILVRKINLNIIVFWVLVIIAGLRYNVGVDYPVYEDILQSSINCNLLLVESLSPKLLNAFAYAVL